MLHGASQPGTPGGGMVWGGFQPLPFSPTALQIAAASGALGSDPSTPVRGRGGAPGAAAGAGAAPFLAVMPGSPMVPVSPGQMMFAQVREWLDEGGPGLGGSARWLPPGAPSYPLLLYTRCDLMHPSALPHTAPVSPSHPQYFGGDGSSKHSHSPPESHHSSGSGDEGDGDSSAGSGSGLEVSDAARQIASAMCAAQQLPGEPPQQVRAGLAAAWGCVCRHAHPRSPCTALFRPTNSLPYHLTPALSTPPPRPQLLELASLLHAYGLVSAVPSAFPGPGAHSGPPSPQRQASPDARARRARQKAAPKLNPDGSVRLNARQRRTLRRAQERAMKALLEAQAKAHGISSEQVRWGWEGRGCGAVLRWCRQGWEGACACVGHELARQAQLGRRAATSDPSCRHPERRAHPAPRAPSPAPRPPSTWPALA